jgi:hypothetical protein
MPNIPLETDSLSRVQAWRESKLGRSYLLWAIRNGILPVRRLPGRKHTRILRSDLARFLEALRHAETEDDLRRAMAKKGGAS